MTGSGRIFKGVSGSSVLERILELASRLAISRRSTASARAVIFRRLICMDRPSEKKRSIRAWKDSTNYFRFRTGKQSPLTLSDRIPRFLRVKPEVSPLLPLAPVQNRSLRTDDKIDEPLNLVSDPDILCVYLDAEFATPVDFERFLLTSMGVWTVIRRTHVSKGLTILDQFFFLRLPKTVSLSPTRSAHT